MKKQNSTIQSFIIKWLLFPCIALILFLLLLAYHPIIALIPIGLVLVLIARKIYLYNKTKAEHLENIKRQQTIGTLIAEYHERPAAFEKYIAELFAFFGYDAKVTPSSNDGGKDIVMTKDGQTYVVEVKLYATYNKISREKVQKLHSAMWDCHANHAIFVTTSSYTSTALEFAARNGIQLIDGTQLVKMIDQRRNTILSATSTS